MRAAEALAALVLCAFAATGLAADPQQGRALYETHCVACHYERLHDRKATKIASYAALKAEVAKWAVQVPRRLTPAELDDIAEYLNQSHYHVAR